MAHVPSKKVAGLPNLAKKETISVSFWERNWQEIDGNLKRKTRYGLELHLYIPLASSQGQTGCWVSSTSALLF